MPTSTVPVEQLDSGGLILDIPPVNLPPNGFSDGRNIRFKDGAIRKMLGETEVFFGDNAPWTATNPIVHLEFWANPNGPTYIVVTADGHVYTVTVSTRGELVTAKRTVNADGSDNPMMHNEDAHWQIVNFNGGYSAILNNGLETPRHMTDSQDLDGGADLRLEDLPGWAGYNVTPEGGTMTEITSVTAANLVAFNNVLIAGGLTERDAAGAIIRDLRGTVRSSDVAAPGTIPQNWDPFQEGINTADEILIADTGIITAMAQLQGNMYVYTANSITQLRLSEDGLSEFAVTSNYGALGRDAVLEFDGTHVVVGSNDIYVFPGHPGSIQSISDGRVRQTFYGTAHYFYLNRMVIVRNQRFDELWFVIATGDSPTGHYDQTFIWNYRNNTWTIRDLPDARAVTVGPVPGGGVSTTIITVGGSGTTGQFELLDAGEQEVQTITVEGTAQAAHNGIFQRQVAEFADPPAPIQVENNEVIHLTVTNRNPGETAQPNLIHAVNSITFPTFTPNKNGSVAGGTRLTLNGTNPMLATVDASNFDFTDGDLNSYLTGLRDYINTGTAAGLEDYTATLSGQTLTLTSTVMGRRTLTAATIVTYTGDTEGISGSTDTVTEGLTFSAVSNPSSGTYAAFDGTSSGTGGITAAVTTTPGGTSIGALGANTQGAFGVQTGTFTYTVQATDSVIGLLGRTEDADGGSRTIRADVSAPGYPQRRWAFPDNTGNGGSGFLGEPESVIASFFAGPAFQTGDLPTNVGASVFASNTPVATFPAGTVITFTARGGGQSGIAYQAIVRRRATVQNPDTHTVRFTNTNQYIVALNGNTSGGARTLNPGAQSPVINLGTNSGFRIASNGGAQQIPAFDSGTRTTSGSAGGINSTVADGGTQPGALNVVNRFAGAAAIGFTTARPDRIEFGTIRITAETSFARVQYVNGQSTTDAARGPAWQEGDAGLGLTAAQVAALPMRNVGDAVTGSGGNGASLVFGTTGRATRAAPVQLYDITYSNTNTYPVTLNGNATPFANRTIAPNGSINGSFTSNSHRISADQQTINLGTVTWTVTNNRPQGLQDEALNVVVNHGGASTPIGSVARGTSVSATSSGGATATTGTWTAEIFQTELLDFNQSTANSAATNIGPITIDRTTHTRIAANSGSGTSTTTDGEVTVTRTTTTGTTTAGVAGGSNIAINPNFEAGRTRITFPANTTVNLTIPISWQLGASQWRGDRSQDDQPYGWSFRGVSSSSLTFGGVTYTGARHYDGSQAFFDQVSQSNAGWPQRLYWRVEAGSGLTFSGPGVGPQYNGPGAPAFPTGNSQALLGNQNNYPVLFDMNVQPPPGNPPGQVDGTGPATSGTASFTLSGTTGADGCTISFFLGHIISNARRVGWSPGQINSLTASTTQHNFTLRNNNTEYELTNLNSNLGGVTASGNLAAGGTRTANNRPSSSWSFSHDATLRYDYDGRVADFNGPATITHADGDITDVPLTTSNQSLATNTSATINVQGNYTVVQGTAMNNPGATAALVREGNGVYGFPDSSAPAVQTEVVYNAGDDSFTAQLPPFGPGDDTPEEYADHLQAELVRFPQFQGINPLDVGAVQPPGAIYYVDREDTDTVRLTNVVAQDHTPGSTSFGAFTSLGGVRYDEGRFGGVVFETIDVTSPGQAGIAPPVVRQAHASGDHITVLRGTYDTGEVFATQLAAGLNSGDIAGESEFVASVTGSELQATRTALDVEDSLITLSYDDNDPGYELPSFRQTRASAPAASTVGTLTVNNPDGGSFVVNLDNVGTGGTGGEPSTITSTELAQAIRDQAPTLTEWTMDNNSDNTVVFRSFTDANLPVDNGILAPIDIVPNVTPGFTGQTLGRAIGGLWNYVFTPGESGTLAGQLPDETAVENTVGVDPTYNPAPGIVIDFNDSATGPRPSIPLTFENFTPRNVADSIQNTLDALEDLDSDQDVLDPLILTVSTLDFGPSGRSVTGIRTQNLMPVTVDLNRISIGTDPERPWGVGAINEGRVYPVIGSDMNIYAGDLGYAFGPNASPMNYTSYVERQHLHLTPTKDTEMLSEVHLHATGSVQTLNVPIMVSNVLNEPVDLVTLSGDANRSMNYTFNVQMAPMDYKIDVRNHGRFFNMRVSDDLTGPITNFDMNQRPVQENWAVATYALEVGKGGTR